MKEELVILAIRHVLSIYDPDLWPLTYNNNRIIAPEWFSSRWITGESYLNRIYDRTMSYMFILSSNWRWPLLAACLYASQAKNNGSHPYDIWCRIEARWCLDISCYARSPTTQTAYSVGPTSIHLRNAIQMAFRWLSGVGPLFWCYWALYGFQNYSKNRFDILENKVLEPSEKTRLR